MNRYRPIVQTGALAAMLLIAGSMHAQMTNARVPAGMSRNLVNEPSAIGNTARTAESDPVVRLPQGWGDQLKLMQPAEQERFLKNSERFRNLPPEQQALIRRRLRIWNNLPIEKREAVLEREQIWAMLPLAKRRQVRESILPRWQVLPVMRRQAILRKLRELRALDAAQRGARLNDGGFLAGMNEEDRQMLRDLASLGVGPAAG
jgi:hypothetical protein